jgi:hypothetical protein
MWRARPAGCHHTCRPCRSPFLHRQRLTGQLIRAASKPCRTEPPPSALTTKSHFSLAGNQALCDAVFGNLLRLSGMLNRVPVKRQEISVYECVYEYETLGPMPPPYSYTYSYTQISASAFRSRHPSCRTTTARRPRRAILPKRQSTHPHQATSLHRPSGLSPPGGGGEAHSVSRY